MSSITSAQNRHGSSASLTERRKAATRMDIARAAAGLFVGRGLKSTRAEDIAQAAGVAPRTFYRYFAAKEEAIAPLYAAGAHRWVEAVRDAPAELDVPQALEHAVRHTLQPGAGVSAGSWDWVRTLIRLAGSSPALSKVWAEVCRASEEDLGEVLAERAGTPAAPAEPAEPAVSATADTAGSAGEGDAVAGRVGRRFTAAVASAAVRTAVEAWAAGDAPPEGEQGPVALALRNLTALQGFDWTC